MVDMSNQSAIHAANIMDQSMGGSAVMGVMGQQHPADEQTSKLMMHQNRIKNISQLSPNEIQGFFQNQVLNSQTSKNNSISI